MEEVCPNRVEQYDSHTHLLSVKVCNVQNWISSDFTKESACFVLPCVCVDVCVCACACVCVYVRVCVRECM